MKKTVSFFFGILFFFFTALTTHAGENISCRLHDIPEGEFKQISALAFDPAGHFLAGMDGSGQILVWDTKVFGLPQFTHKVSRPKNGRLVFSSDGKIIYASDGKKVIAWPYLTQGAEKEYKQKEAVTCFNISADGRSLIAGGSKGGLTVWDVKTGKAIKTVQKAHKKNVKYVGFTGDTSFRSVGEDRKMHFWDLNRARPISTVMDDFRSEYKVVETDPEFSLWAIGTIVVQVQKMHAGIREFHNIYIKDGVTWADAGVLKGHNLRIKALGFSPDGSYLVSGGDGKVLNIWDLETGRVDVDMPFEAEISAVSFSPDGQWLAAAGEDGLLNVYAVKGVHGKKTVSPAFLTAEPDLSPGEKYAVVVGLSKFVDPGISPLTYTVADARSFADFLIKKEKFPAENVKLLLDEQATKVNIEDAFKSFLPKNAGREDMVIIFFAGHGVPDTDLSGRSDDGVEKYLVPYDADLNRTAATCFPMSEFTNIFSSIRSRKVVFFIDSCFSGGASGKGLSDALKRTFSNRPKGLRAISITPRFLNQLTEGPEGYGKVLITASQANEQALELPELGHGLFTYYLLEALSGKADNGDGYVTLKEVYDYLEDRVAMKSRKEGGKQTPMMAGSITGKIVLSNTNQE